MASTIPKLNQRLKILLLQETRQRLPEAELEKLLLAEVDQRSEEQGKPITQLMDSMKDLTTLMMMVK